MLPFLVVLTVASTACLAQQSDDQEIPYRYTCRWVTETNVNERPYTIVKFFDGEEKLIYEERIEGIRLDITRRKTVKLLNRTLKMLVEKRLVGEQIKTSAELPIAIARRKAEQE